MTDFTDLGERFKEAFNLDPKSLTVQQLWVLVNFGRHVRGRCRSNAALVNYLSKHFGHRFKMVEKLNKDRTLYNGLEII